MDLIEFKTTFDTDEYIFKEGDPGDCAYIIESGMVEVVLDKDGRKLVMATLTKGDIVGEMAIIDRLPRTASARAIVPTEVTAIPLDYVSQKIEQSDPTVRMFLRLTMARYRDLNARLGLVFEGLSLGQGDSSSDSFASSTMELKNVMSQFIEMQKRIDSAVSKPVKIENSELFGEKTLEVTKLLVTEEKLLKDAMAKKEFRLHYQPIIDLSNNQIVGCEALVRWNHPSGELMLPSRFVSQAEDSGLIIDLGYWVAEQACQFQSRLYNDFEHDLFVAINLSGRQFDDQFLVTSLADIMDRTGASRERIKFEITESLLIDNPELANRSLHQLKETGAKLAIDDFGTGYSSFSYLHRFPFDTLKIDRVFISAMARSQKSEQIVRSLVNLSRDLGMEVVAEGIASKQEAELMRNYKTTLGQGFYFSRPVNETKFVKLLRQPQIKLTG
ncbi:MAG: EAL domain-containing protein [Gammaproteobacteria bacterium]|nr:MAG: EAL domain-containing protein [Gammaproteobacteria bacterium]